MTGPGATTLRIGDAEREQAVADLGDHFAAGRLTPDELDDRLELAWRARTSAELTPLFADLPSRRERSPAGDASRPAPMPHRRSRTGPRRLAPILVLVLIMSFVALWRGGPPWPLIMLAWLWILGFLGARHGHRPVRFGHR